MGQKEQVPALAIFVQGSLWVWSATSWGRPHDGGLALAVSPMPLSIFLFFYVVDFVVGREVHLRSEVWSLRARTDRVTTCTQ